MDRRIGLDRRQHSRSGSYLLILVSLALFLSACGASAGTNAKRACNYVESSITIYKHSEVETNPLKAQATQRTALNLLRLALPYAAVAAGSNGEFQALEATLSETNRVPEKNLLEALQRECAQILPSKTGSGVPGGYVPPTNIQANESQ